MANAKKTAPKKSTRKTTTANPKTKNLDGAMHMAEAVEKDLRAIFKKHDLAGGTLFAVTKSGRKVTQTMKTDDPNGFGGFMVLVDMTSRDMVVLHGQVHELLDQHKQAIVGDAIKSMFGNLFK